MMYVCEKSKNCCFFSCKGEIFKLVDYINLWTISLDRVSTVLSSNGGIEEKTKMFEGEEIRPNDMTQFPLQDHVSIYTYSNEHYLY